MRELPARWRMRIRWERRWSPRRERFPWLETGPRPQVTAARDAGWIPVGSSVLDLGCGLGHAAAWLAAHGHPTTGLDVSSRGLGRARSLHRDVAGLTFWRADLGRPIAFGDPFDVVLDLGCLHQLPAPLYDSYGANVRRATRPGSRLLYLLRTGATPGSSPEAKAALVHDVLGPSFEPVAATVTEMRASHHPHPRLGVELRFIRR